MRPRRSNIAGTCLALVVATVALAAGGCGETRQQRDSPAAGSDAPASAPGHTAPASPAAAPDSASGSAPAAPPSSNAAATGFPRTLRDASGESLTLPERPRRIASQTLVTDEILFAICDRARIVGVSTVARDRAYSNVAAEAEAHGAPALVNVEIALSLDPDLTFVGSYSRAELVALMKSNGARVFRFSNFDRIADIESNIRTLGYAIGEEAAADRLVADMEQRLARVRARVSAAAAAATARGATGDTRPRVMSYDVSGFAAGANTLFDDVIRAAGGVNVAAEHGIKGFPRVSAEQLLAWQPDYVVSGAKAGEEEIIRGKLLGNPAFAATNAAKAGHLIVMDTRHLLTTSHHVVRAVEDLADGLYGKQPPSAADAASGNDHAPGMDAARGNHTARAKETTRGKEPSR